MNNAELMFVALLKQAAFKNNNLEQLHIKAEEFDLIEQLASTHICQLLIGNELRKYRDTETVTSFEEMLKRIVYKNYRNISVQNEVIKQLKQAGIKCVVLKGSSVAIYYPNPLLRVFGDVDILVPEDQYDRVIDLLLNGKNRDLHAQEHKFHYAMDIKGVSVEIHKHVTEYESESINVSKVMNDVFENIKIGKIDTYEFPMLNTEHQALALLLHLKRHIAENNINMRMLLDWIVFAASVSDEEWNFEIYPKLKEINMDIIADALFILSDKFFATKSGGKIKNTVQAETVDMLMEEFISCSAKDTAVRLSGNVALLYSSAKGTNCFSKTVNVMNELSKRNFSFSKHKIMLPICWMIIVLRYIYRVITKKRAKISVKRIRQSAEGKDKLFKALKIK